MLHVTTDTDWSAGRDARKSAAALGKERTDEDNLVWQRPVGNMSFYGAASVVNEALGLKEGLCRSGDSSVNQSEIGQQSRHWRDPEGGAQATFDM